MPFAAQLLMLFVAMSLLAWGVVAWVHILPRLAARTQRDALLFVLTPQLFRHVGALALFPGIAAVPRAWSVPLAWGDILTALFSAVAMIALHRRLRHANTLVWGACLFGLGDLLHNGSNAMALQVAAQLGVVAYVVGFAVPGMLVFHLLALRILLRPADDPAPSSSEPGASPPRPPSEP